MRKSPWSLAALDPRRRPVRMFGRVSVLAAACGLAGASLASAATGAPAAGAQLAPALGGAASGGAVIVVLKDQHTNLSLRTQAAQLDGADHADQAPLVAAIKAAGGSGIIQLTAPNAVAATVPAAAVASLRANPAVAEVVNDPSLPAQPQQGSPAVLAQFARARPAPLVLAQDRSADVAAAAVRLPRRDLAGLRGRSSALLHGQRAGSLPGATTSLVSDPPFVTHTIPQVCPPYPVQEPEAVADVHASTGNPDSPDMANSIATGEGVIIANQGLNEEAGNPNFIRPDGQPVIIDAPAADYKLNDGNDETEEDAANEAGQGTVIFQYSKSLPYAGISPSCRFYIKGVAPGASLVDLTGIDTPILSEAQAIAGIDDTVSKIHADVISESFGGRKLLSEANDAAVAAGVFVVESAGDSGPQGTFTDNADDPHVVAAAGVDNLHIIALNDGDSSYVSNNMAAQSSGGTAPTGKLPDLAASDWFGGETDCAALGTPQNNGCPFPNYPVEAAAGTSEAAPMIAGAAADVIQAYRDTHNGASPSPALITQILTSTATNINAPAAEQGHGLLNVYAAVRAAQQMPGSTYQGRDRRARLIASTPQTDSGQIDITGNGGTTSTERVSLYNTGSVPVTVHGTLRTLGPERQLGPVVTENVSAPPASTPTPPAGDTAAAPIRFDVPRGLDRLDADMIWPDPTNSNVIAFQLFDPQGALVQESYNDGVPASSPGQLGSSPDIQHVEVSDPTPGVWTATFQWPILDDYCCTLPPVPGPYRGPMSFKVSGQRYLTIPATGPVTIPSHGSVSVPVPLELPSQIGDHPEMLEFTRGRPAPWWQPQTLAPSVMIPVSRRTLIPPDGGQFNTLITSSCGRGRGQVNTYEIDVPAGRSVLSARFETADTSPDNSYTYELIDPSGNVAAKAGTPTTVNGQPSGAAQLSVPNPAAGLWQVEVVLNLTTSGKEFTQTVHGQLSDS